MGIQNLSVLGESLQRGASTLFHGQRAIVPAADQVAGGTIEHLYVSRRQASQLLEVTPRELDTVAPGVAFRQAIGGGKATFARVEAISLAARGAGKVAPDRLDKVEQLLAEQASGNLSTRDAREALGMSRGLFSRWRRDADAPLPYVRTSAVTAPLAVRQVIPAERLRIPTRHEGAALEARQHIGELAQEARRLTSEAAGAIRGRAAPVTGRTRAVTGALEGNASRPAPTKAAAEQAPEAADRFYRRHSGKLAIATGAGVLGGGFLLAGNDGARH